MPPGGTVNCDPEVDGRLNGRAEISQVIGRENGTTTIGPRIHHAHRLAGKGNVVPIFTGEIPWRTSRRLQEATLQSIKDRDGGYIHNHDFENKEGSFRSTESMPPLLASKRPQSESESTGEKQEDHPAEAPAEESGNPFVAESEQTPAGAETSTTTFPRARRKDNKRKVQFNDPLHVFRLKGNNAIASISSNAPDKGVPNHVPSTPGTSWNKTTAGKAQQPAIAGSKIPTNTIIKPPQSCFDLLCSHAGFRGWRCYRSRVVGQAFCVYHRRESAPAAGICLYS